MGIREILSHVGIAVPDDQEILVAGVPLKNSLSRKASLMSFSPHVVPPKHTSDSSNEMVGDYVRKTFDVQAVQVTAKNMADVAVWCDGQMTWENINGPTINFILVPTSNSTKSNEAKIGDWIVKIPKAGKNKKDVYTIYNQYAFQRAFAPKVTAEEAVLEMMRTTEPKNVVAVLDYEGPKVDDVTFATERVLINDRIMVAQPTEGFIQAKLVQSDGTEVPLEGYNGPDERSQDELDTAMVNDLRSAINDADRVEEGLIRRILAVQIAKREAQMMIQYIKTPKTD